MHNEINPLDLALSNVNPIERELLELEKYHAVYVEKLQPREAITLNKIWRQFPAYADVGQQKILKTKEALAVWLKKNLQDKKQGWMTIHIPTISNEDSLYILGIIEV